ncbi:MAG: phosphomannose isomerase type II C-terminal cupin domain [Candidatus Omnitrophica bacterium]|nr:phosphomannose isomerase type II C-terminal cupin domain [Candidatus Omnitrophota bacterium]
MISEGRPWGMYEVLHRAPGVQVKRIEVKPGLRFSLQKHRRRSEKWVVIAGTGVATVGDRQIAATKGVFLDVPCGEAHRMRNTGKDPLVFIEVQFGDYLGEDDIVRLADDFGRTGSL